MWIQTYSGVQFFPLDPRPEDVRLEDIAHALSLICRFTGHSREFYSVAQHSCLVSQHIGRRGICHDAPIKYRLRVAALALLHDAHEAYFADIAKPLKGSLNAGAIERPIQDAILCRFGVNMTPEIAAAIKYEDAAALATEARDLMGPPPAEWDPLPPPWEETIEPWSWREAERCFLLAAGCYGITEACHAV